MKVEIKVPVMGESVSEAIVSSILIPSGSFAEAGQEILELETDKVNQVLYAPQSGALSYVVSVGDTVKIGDVIGHVETDVKKEEKTPPPAQEAKKEVQKSNEPAAPKVEATPPKQRPLETGGARKTAEQFVQEIGKPKKEIEKAGPRPAEPSSREQGTTRKKMTGLRKTIASRLVEAKNTTAMLTTFNEVDLSAVIDIRNKEKDNFLSKYGVKLGFMSFFVKATVAALKAYPLVNSFIDGDDIVTYNTYDIGVAVSTEKGLFVPVVRKCNELTFGGIEKEIAAHAKKAREGGISVDDLKGGSFTITNGGVFGSLLSTPILNPPQSAILGMHAIVKRPVAVEDKVVIRPMMYLALSYDHRIIDGREAVLFLVHIKESLEDPARLLLDL
jgi:2-oxoglutarate dehydrogenase E2 component (dihydrolipoamide succinyltransferase)